MNGSVRGVCHRPELLCSLSSTLKRSFRSYLPIFGVIFSIALFLKSSGFKGFLRVAHSFGVVLPIKLVFLQKKKQFGVVPSTDTLLILAILTCHFRVVYSIAVVLPKKLVFATSRQS